MTPLTRVVVALVRGWTRLYTSGLPGENRIPRRQEIESDLWESLNDPGARGLPMTLLCRLVGGIPDDLGWRAEQPRPANPEVFAVLFAGACVLILMGLMTWAGTVASLPLPEPLSHARAERRPPPPPPPPPPFRATRNRR